jgi:hypothetical protein
VKLYSSLFDERAMKIHYLVRALIGRPDGLSKIDGLLPKPKIARWGHRAYNVTA